MERSGLLADTLLILPGFAQTALTRAENGENVSLWPPALEIADVIDGMKGPFLRLFFTRKDVGFSDAAAQLLQKYASPLARLPDGSPRAPLEKRVARGLLGKDFPWEALKNVYGEDPRVFPFDFFLSPLDNADALFNFLCENGIEKADFLSLNFGSGVLLSFLEKHPEKADRAVFVSPRFEGLDLAADVYEDRLTAARVTQLMWKMSGKTVESFRELLKMVPQEVMEAMLRKLRTEAVGTVLKNAPGAWATVPAERLTAALDAVFGEETSPVRTKAAAFGDLLTRRKTLLKNASLLDGDLMHPFPEAAPAVLSALSR